MISQKARTILLTVTIITMIACAPLLLPSGSPSVPTLAPGELEVIIAQTAAMAASQTATLIPPTPTVTLTPSPTVTASVTPSPTATFIFLMPTLVPTSDSGGKYSCKITSVSPPYDATLSSGQPFNARWELLNNGTEIWDGNSVDYSYSSGAKMHEGPKARDFETMVAPGGTVEIVIRMKAPNEPGTHATVWKLHVKDEYFCPMTIQIIVPSR